MNVGLDRLENNLAKRVAKVRRRVSVYPEGWFGAIRRPARLAHRTGHDDGGGSGRRTGVNREITSHDPAARRIELNRYRLRMARRQRELHGAAHQGQGGAGIERLNRPGQHPLAGIPERHNLCRRNPRLRHQRDFARRRKLAGLHSSTDRHID